LQQKAGVEIIAVPKPPAATQARALKLSILSEIVYQMWTPGLHRGVVWRGRTLSDGRLM
jgi:hypothetical protein